MVRRGALRQRLFAHDGALADRRGFRTPELQSCRRAATQVLWVALRSPRGAVISPAPARRLALGGRCCIPRLDRAGVGLVPKPAVSSCNSVPAAGPGSLDDFVGASEKR